MSRPASLTASSSSMLRREQMDREAQPPESTRRSSSFGAADPAHEIDVFVAPRVGHAEHGSEQLILADGAVEGGDRVASRRRARADAWPGTTCRRRRCRRPSARWGRGNVASRRGFVEVEALANGREQRLGAAALKVPHDAGCTAGSSSDRRGKRPPGTRRARPRRRAASCARERPRRCGGGRRRRRARHGREALGRGRPWRRGRGPRGDGARRRRSRSRRRGTQPWPRAPPRRCPRSARYVRKTGSSWAPQLSMWRVRSSSLSARVFSCFLMRVARRTRRPTRSRRRRPARGRPWSAA
jgi:hypothetical protein